MRRHCNWNVTAVELKTQLGEPSVCYLCGLPVGWGDAELDHIIPLSQGGATKIENLNWSHRRCNRIKHDLTVAELVKYIGVILGHLTKSHA
jgi:5-methylcytosine-specific restriction endonuclease McrA